MSIVWGKPSGLCLVRDVVPISIAAFHPIQSSVLLLGGHSLAGVYRFVFRQAPPAAEISPQNLDGGKCENVKPPPDEKPPSKRSPSSTPEKQTSLKRVDGAPQLANESEQGPVASALAAATPVASAGPTPLTEAPWLHGKPVLNPDCQFKNLCMIRDHTSLLVNAKWSPKGSQIATADANSILVWDFDGISVTRSYSVSLKHECFDFAWLGEEVLIVGSIECLIVMRRNQQLWFEQLPDDGAFCKGLTANRVSASLNEDVQTFKIGVSTDRSCLVYDLQLQNLSPRIRVHVSGYHHVIDSEFFDGSQVPMLIPPVFGPDCTYMLVPYGQRRGQYFGLCKRTDDKDSKPFRFRGHRTRVNCCAVGNNLHQCPLSPSAILRLMPQLSQLEVDDAQVINDEHWPLICPYAQASVDGCLSVWWVFYSRNGNPLSAQCLVASPSSIVDETALITSLTWSSDDQVLVVGADDCKATVLSMQMELGKIIFQRRESQVKLNTLMSCTEHLRVPDEENLVPDETTPQKEKSITSPIVLVTPDV